MKKIIYLAILLVLLLGTVPAAMAQSPDQPIDLTKILPPPSSVPASGATIPLAGGYTKLVLDDFNRADGPLGPNWTVRDGLCGIFSNQASCGNVGRATFNNAPGDGNAAEMDIACISTALDYEALLLDYGAGATNLFIKVQNQSGDLMFHNAACYTGNNGAPFGPGFFALTSPFSTAHMTVTRVGNDVTILFSNIDGGGQPDQEYLCSGAPPVEGTGIGIAGYAQFDRVDNFGNPALANFLHINKDKMKFAPTGQPGIFRVVFKARIWDQDNLAAPDVNVLGTFTFPDGSQHPMSAMTNSLGLVKFVTKQSMTGEYGFCITDLVKSGYVYDPGANTAPECLTVVVVP